MTSSPLGSKHSWTMKGVASRSVTFLGYIIYSEGVEVDQRKTEVVENWPRPLTSTDIRCLFGLTRYYRRFVNGYAFIASP